MLILFKPWYHAKDLRENGEHWSDGFMRFMCTCPKQFKKIMDNMQILHECRDSRDDHFADCQNQNRIRSRRAPGEFTGSRNADDDFDGEDDEDVLILEHLQSIDSSTSTSREVSDDNLQKCL